MKAGYEERFYREYVKSDLKSTHVMVEETDLQIYSRDDVAPMAEKWVRQYREEIKQYIDQDPQYLRSLKPMAIPLDAPSIVRHMAEAAQRAQVGPMAAVAGAMAEYVGKKLLQYTQEIIVENGGDLFIKSSKIRKILIYTGDSPFSNQIALEISPKDTPLGICTSSGTLGHSLSFGLADAVVVLSRDTLLADAAATAIGNRVKTVEDIEKALDYGRAMKDICGVLIIVGDKMGAWGNVKITKP